MFVRRIATVTICAPDATTAARVSAKSLYLPVPTRRRDRYARPAMSSGSTTERDGVCGAFMAAILLRSLRRRAAQAGSARASAESAAADGADDLQPVAFRRQAFRRSGFAARSRRSFRPRCAFPRARARARARPRVRTGRSNVRGVPLTVSCIAAGVAEKTPATVPIAGTSASRCAESGPAARSACRPRKPTGAGAGPGAATPTAAASSRRDTRRDASLQEMMWPSALRIMVNGFARIPAPRSVPARPRRQTSSARGTGEAPSWPGRG